VTIDQPLFEIVDLSTVWMLADVYESDLPARRRRPGRERDAALLARPHLARAA